jgi:hypothetical protein
MENLTDKQVQNALEMIIEYFGGIPGDGAKVEFWDKLAAKLSRVVGQSPAWSWRYPQSVYLGTTRPSKKFTSAVFALGAALDEVPTVLAYTVQVRVYAKPGQVVDNSLVLGSSKSCARPGCRVMMVPNVPWRQYCSDECREMAKDAKAPD